MKLFASVIALMFSTQLVASTWLVESVQRSFRTQAAVNLIDWQVGDRADYDVDMGVASGTMGMLVREQVEDNFWINQSLSLGSAGDYLVEMLVNPSTGEILELIVNGEPKDIPEEPEVEIITAQDESITVPAGTFMATHLKTKEVGTDKEFDSWTNSSEIPVFGLIKSIQPGQFGKVKIDLTGFVEASFN